MRSAQLPHASAILLVLALAACGTASCSSESTGGIPTYGAASSGSGGSAGSAGSSSGGAGGTGAAGPLGGAGGATADGASGNEGVGGASDSGAGEGATGEPPVADTPKAKVISYLSSLVGNKTVAGQHDKLNTDPSWAAGRIHDITGKDAGLWSADFGFGSDGVDNRSAMIAEAKSRWQRGAIVQLMYHTCAPTRDEYCGWDDIGGAYPQHLTDDEWSELVTDGTPLNQAWKTRLDGLAVFFTELKDAGVAPLFRPLHEMNQGVFWWGGRGGPDGTRKLYQLTHDYLTNTWGFDNLIWVWDVQDFGSLESDVTDYDPGPSYYDIVALDFYNGDGYTQQKYDVMKAAAGTKLLAIGECDTPPSPDTLASQPDWVFFMLWPDFIDQNQGALQDVYSSPRVVTLDQMPGW